MSWYFSFQLKSNSLHNRLHTDLCSLVYLANIVTLVEKLCKPIWFTLIRITWITANKIIDLKNDKQIVIQNNQQEF